MEQMVDKHSYECHGGTHEKLIQDNLTYKGSGGFILKMRRKLVFEARCAIKQIITSEEGSIGFIETRSSEWMMPLLWVS